METLCTTCNRPLDNPYRRVVDGRVVEGCVDEAHTGHVHDDWHDRPAASTIRRGRARRLLLTLTVALVTLLAIAGPASASTAKTPDPTAREYCGLLRLGTGIYWQQIHRGFAKKGFDLFSIRCRVAAPTATIVTYRLKCNRPVRVSDWRGAWTCQTGKRVCAIVNLEWRRGKWREIGKPTWWDAC